MTTPFRFSRLAPKVFTIALGLGLGAVFACDDDDTQATPAAVDGGADTGANKLLCGQVGTLCAGNEWCAYELVGSCGREGQNGNCKARPTSCAIECPAVCGCDGKLYCNSCEAQLAGSDVDKNRNCIPAGGEMSAYALFTDPPKLVIYKRDDARKICVRLTLVARLGTKFGLDVPANWGVEEGEITRNPEDCIITSTGLPPTPKEVALHPVGGQGRVTYSSDFGKQGKYPCSVSIDARLAFDASGEFSWAPNVEVLKADDIVANGSCP